MPVRGHVGSDYERLRPEFRVIPNPWSPSERIMLVPPIAPDVALIHAIAATADGTLLLDHMEDDALLAQASRAVVASTERIVAPEELRRGDGVILQGIHVTALVEAPGGARPTFVRGGSPVAAGAIDQHGNLNLITVGDHERPRVRFPGGAGAAMLYYMPRRVVVFRADHSPRVFVERVDTVTSPGATPPDVVRPGGPWKVVTPLCVFRYDRRSAGLVVESLHPGVSREELGRRTGFAPAYDGVTGVTPAPTHAELEILRTRVKDTVARTYPPFATTAFAH